MTRIFRVYSTTLKLLAERSTLEDARQYTSEVLEQAAYIEERSESGGLLQVHSFFPPPQPTPSRTGIVDDITQSAAWARCCDLIAKEIQHRSLSNLVGQALSQPHESVLEDYCESVAKFVFSNNIDLWVAVIPATGSQDEAERCIVDELEGFARVELRIALVRLRNLVQDAVVICDRME